MEKKRKWTVLEYKGQIDFHNNSSQSRIFDLRGERKWPPQDDPDWITHDSNWTFKADIKFVGISRPSASGLQFIFADLEGKYRYTMLPESFVSAIKHATMGIISGTFGVEKRGTSIGITYISNK